MFSTKLAYVTAVQNGSDITYQLIVADSDGYAPQSLVTSNEPLLSPSWSPDGKKIAYVSFEQGNSAIYIQDLSTGAVKLRAEAGTEAFEGMLAGAIAGSSGDWRITGNGRDGDQQAASAR